MHAFSFFEEVGAHFGAEGMAEEGLDVGMGPGMEGKLPSKEELLEAIQQMSDMDEESKKKLIESIMSSAPAEGGEGLPRAEETVAAVSNLTFEMLMLLSLISLVLLVLGEIFLNYFIQRLSFFKSFNLLNL